MQNMTKGIENIKEAIKEPKNIVEKQDQEIKSIKKKAQTKKRSE